MQSDHDTEAKHRFSILMENETGVMEVVLEAVAVDQGVMFRLMGSVPQSGSLRATDTTRLVEAVQLLRWAEENPGVFEGITSPDPQTAD
jgi:hypothetical protein